MYEDSVYPSAFDCNFVLKKARFFLGDRWLVIGPVEQTSKVVEGRLVMEIKTPDIEEFFAARAHLDDGTMDWIEWGPRVN